MIFQHIYLYLVDQLTGTYTGRILAQFFTLVRVIGPYFLISVVLNAVLRTILMKRKWTINTRNKTLGIFIGGLAGLISPLPTYVAVPMGLSLMSTGLPFSAVVAFMVASPLLNPGVFYLTLTQLGIGMALARLISAYCLALGAGFLSRFVKKWIQKPKDSISHDAKHDYPHRSFWIELAGSFRFLGKYFVMAVFIGACVKVLVPEELINKILGGSASTSLAAAVALGVPFYSCGGAAIPLVQVLGQMGMNPGAALAFFIAGPSTKLETMYAYRSLMGTRSLIYFLVFTLLGSFAFGSAYYKLSGLFIH